MVPDRLSSSVEPLYGCAHNNFASSLTLECHKTFRRVWHRGFRAPRTTNGRFAPEPVVPTDQASPMPRCEYWTILPFSLLEANFCRILDGIAKTQKASYLTVMSG